MGLFAALRDRLFGPSPGADEQSAADAGEAAGAPSNEAPAPVEADAAAAEPASMDAATSEAMPKRSSEQPSERAAGDDQAVAARQERVASRLLEDERLRGDLTDDEFQPLLDWAMAAADRLVASTA